MIEIITRAGISLDLAPDALFEVELENPMLSDEHIPVAYSTSISFLPTLKNKRVFGYLPAILLEPQVKEVAVSVQVRGIPLFFGTLVYDGIEEGNINYTFSGRNLEDDWSGYIHSLSHLTEKKFEYNEETPLSVLGEWWGYYMDIKNGTVEADFEYPTLVGSANIADIEHRNNFALDKVDTSVKYRNYPYAFWTLSNPAVKVADILSKAFTKTTMSPLITKRYEALAILGMYKRGTADLVLDENLDFEFCVADALPECTVSSLVKNILKMFCATLYRDGARFKIVTNKEVLEDEVVTDWSNKVSDAYSLSTQSRQGYTFHFNNDDSENTGVTEPSETIESGGSSVVNVSALADVIKEAEAHQEYIAMRYAKTGDIYNGKSVKVWNLLADSPEYTMPYLDMLLHKMEKYNTDEGDSNYDNAIDFRLVRCMPTKILAQGSKDIFYHMCPIVDFPAAETGRTSNIWIGTLLRGQLVDKGVAFTRPTVTEVMSEYIDNELSLDPAVLYQTYHKEFASWLAQDRRIVTTDIYLTPQDIAALRLYRKVSIYSQEFFIKKISLTFSAGSDYVGARGEFISATWK